MKRVRVLIVDDSASMRQLIAACLARDDPGIQVVAEATNPYEARDAIKAHNPDVVTLDVEMPRMNGLSFLEKLMRLRPTPVVMVSSLTTGRAEATIQALEIGAVDCVAKPSHSDVRPFPDLAIKVRAAAGSHPHVHRDRGALKTNRAGSRYRPNNRVVLIGASTGGVEALCEVISAFPANAPPTLIALHMPSPFTMSFARRLDRSCAPSVSEAVDGAPIVCGHVYLAPGGLAHLEVARGRALRCTLRPGEPVNGHRPSVDALFASAARVCGPDAVGVLLTGMGRDGSHGLLQMRRAGARTIGQDEATSVVYGMPRTAFDLGAVEKQLPLHEIGAEILAATAAPNQED
jgi:two-component system, chemotaxis family, protein-glutamate methylesterase/glutaminase